VVYSCSRGIAARPNRALGPRGPGPIPLPTGRMTPIESTLWYELALHFTSVLTCTTPDTPDDSPSPSQPRLRFPNIVKPYGLCLCLTRLSKNITHYSNARETACGHSIDR
jgi:hypothetical protein